MVRPSLLYPQQSACPSAVTPHEWSLPVEMLAHVVWPEGTVVCPPMIFPQQSPTPSTVTPHE